MVDIDLGELVAAGQVAGRFPRGAPSGSGGEEGPWIFSTTPSCSEMEGIATLAPGRWICWHSLSLLLESGAATFHDFVDMHISIIVVTSTAVIMSEKPFLAHRPAGVFTSEWW